MTISLHNQTTAPNTAVATSVSPLDPSGSSKTKFSKTGTDIYQIVTDNIIAALEAGVKPWSCPWQRIRHARSAIQLRHRRSLQWHEYHVAVVQCVKTGVQRFTLVDL